MIPHSVHFIQIWRLIVNHIKQNDTQHFCAEHCHQITLISMEQLRNVILNLCIVKAGVMSLFAVFLR